MLALLLTSGLAFATGLGATDGRGAPEVCVDDVDLRWMAPLFRDAAADHGVPEVLLMALAWEASHWDPDAASQWGGYGLFDLREDGEGPGPLLEDAAILLGRSPDRIIADPAWQAQAAAALLARSARVAHGGHLPPVDDLEAWWTAVASFSGRHEPNLQDMYARFVFGVVADGVERGGLRLPATEVDIEAFPFLPPPPTTCDYSGCYQFINASSSNYSNYSRGASDISYVIIHTVQGSYSGCISWFQNSSAEVSAHYVVRSSDGQVTQMVSEADVAWHAGNWDYNLASVGIEHEGYVDDPGTWYTSAMYAGSAALTSDIAARNGIPADRAYIIGHNEVPGATHTDPGSGWDWSTYMSLISGGAASGDIIGAVRDSDIYSGANLVGATVRIAETGETTTVGGDGFYRFYDEPLGTYTMWASMSGYDDGSCTKELSAGDNWCSIALMPASDGGGDGGGADDSGTTGDGGSPDGGSADGGSADGGTTGDGGTADGGGADPGGDPPGQEPHAPPGGAVALTELGGGCSSAPALAGLGLALAGMVGAAGRRRRT